MKNFKSTYSAFEGCEIHQFSESELAMVMGGGEDQIVSFLDDDYDLDDDDNF